jgi:hypothetical protein
MVIKSELYVPDYPSDDEVNEREKTRAVALAVEARCGRIPTRGAPFVARPF